MAWLPWHRLALLILLHSPVASLAEVDQPKVVSDGDLTPKLNESVDPKNLTENLTDMLSGEEGDSATATTTPPPATTEAEKTTQTTTPLSDNLLTPVENGHHDCYIAEQIRKDMGWSPDEDDDDEPKARDNEFWCCQDVQYRCNTSYKPDGGPVIALNWPQSPGQLQGSIPDRIGDLSELEELKLSNNAVEGSIPDAVGKLTKLRILQLASNKIGGSLPMMLGYMTDLTDLDISTNKLQGHIPEIFGQMPNIQNINLGSNQLSGSIPDYLFTPWDQMLKEIGGDGEEDDGEHHYNALPPADWPGRKEIAEL